MAKNQNANGITQDELELSLESESAYVKKVSAQISREKAAAANIVTIILASAVASLPFIYVLALYCLPSENDETLAEALGDWLRIVGPILGTAVGALLGVSLASSLHGGKDS